MYDSRISDQTNMKRMADTVVTSVKASTRFGTTHIKNAPPNRHTHEKTSPREGTLAADSLPKAFGASPSCASP